MQRKLKDLKENECIKVSTLAQAEYFIKKLKWLSTSAKELTGSFISKGIDYHWFDINIKNLYEYPASDFIKPKKSKFKKYVKQELAKIDSELYDIKERVSKCLTTDGTGIQFDFGTLNVETRPLRPEIEEGLINTLTKNELLEKTDELETGKWYKGDVEDDIAIYFITEIKGKDITAYGINYKGVWVETKEGFGTIDCPNIRLATKEDVESALIEEAKRRGFKNGVKVNRSMFEPIISNNIIIEGETFRYFSIDDTLEIGGNAIYDKGKWATIVEEPKQEIDWSKAGQILKSKGGITAINNGIHDGLKFWGICINTGDRGKGMFFNKGAFYISNTPVTLSNNDI